MTSDNGRNAIVSRTRVFSLGSTTSWSIIRSMSNRPAVVGIERRTTEITVLVLDQHLAILGRGYCEIPRSEAVSKA